MMQQGKKELRKQMRIEELSPQHNFHVIIKFWIFPIKYLMNKLRCHFWNHIFDIKSIVEKWRTYKKNMTDDCKMNPIQILRGDETDNGSWK